MVDFRFQLNRQGPRGAKGPQGEKGDAGLTYVPRTGTNTPTETTVIFETTEGQSYETPNLKYPIEDRGGDYLRLDRDENTQYYGNPNYADLSHNPGEVILLNADDFSHGDPVELEGYAVSGQFITSALNKINNDFTDVNNAIALKADQATTYTKTETNTLLNGKANTVHTHTLSQITDAGSLAGKNTVNYNTEVTNKPTIPTVGNGTITITQGGVTKGTFTTNQSGNSTIALDAGGGGSTYTAGDGINISSDIISVKVDESTIDFDTNGKLKVISSVTPANMVTTNTIQDITGTKYFKSGGTGDNQLSITTVGTNGNECPAISAKTDNFHYSDIFFADNSDNTGSCIKLVTDNAEVVAYDINTSDEYPIIHTGNIDTNTISYNQTTKNIEVIGGKLNTIIKTNLCKTNKNASITSNILTVPREYYDGTDNPTSFGYVQVPATSYLYFRGVMNRLDSTGDDFGICGFGNTITISNSADSLFIDRYSGGRLTPNNYTDITYLSGMSDSGSLYFDLIYDNGNTSFIIYTDDTFTTTSATYTCSSTPTTYTYIILGCRSTLINSSSCTYDLSKSCYKTSSNGNLIPLYNESAGTVLIKGLDSRYLGIDANNNLTLDIQAIKDAIDNL